MAVEAAGGVPEGIDEIQTTLDFPFREGTSLAAMLAIAFWIPDKQFAWPWYTLTGTIITLGVAAAVHATLEDKFLVPKRIEIGASKQWGTMEPAQCDWGG